MRYVVKLFQQLETKVYENRQWKKKNIENIFSWFTRAHLLAGVPNPNVWLCQVWHNRQFSTFGYVRPDITETRLRQVLHNQHN